MNMKSNMAFAALLSAGLLAMVAGKVAQYSVSPHHLEKDAVTVEGAADTSGGGAPAVAMPEPILALIAKADVEKGKGIAKACEACHHIEKGGPNSVGPGLYGVVGNKKMMHPDYAYSGSLNKQGGDVWTYEELNKFLYKPKAYASETKMTFVGLKKGEDRAAVIDYLRTMDDSPQAEPTPAEIDKEAKDLAPPAPATPAGVSTPDAKPGEPASAKDAKPSDGKKVEVAPASIKEEPKK